MSEPQEESATPKEAQEQPDEKPQEEIVVMEPGMAPENPQPESEEPKKKRRFF